MVFRRLKTAFGGGTTVDAVVHTPVAQPGGTVQGVIEIVGGDFEQRIDQLTVALVVRVEVERDDTEHRVDQEFAEHRVTGGFTLQPGQRQSVPFGLGLPLQTPFNVVGGEELGGVRLGLRTDLEIARSLDKGDFDPIRVQPLPAQHRLLGAFERIGCRFLRSDVERGRIPGADLPFYQELEFSAPPELRGRLSEVEVTFLAGPHQLDMLIEADRRGGFLDAGGDRIHRLSIGYDAIERENWDAILREHLHELARRRGLFG